VHPSALLHAPDEEMRRRGILRFIDDLPSRGNFGKMRAGSLRECR
jgi:hypothetical protein